MKVTQVMWLGIAILMVIPIVMVFLSLTLKNPANRWANIIVAIVFFAPISSDCLHTLRPTTNS